MKIKLFDKNYFGHSFINNETFHPSNIKNNYDWKCEICKCLCLFARTNINEVYYLREGYMNYIKHNNAIDKEKCLINFTCDEYIIKSLLE